MKHTPGPWMAHGSEKTAFGHRPAKIVSANGLRFNNVAHVYDEDTLEETMANMHLLASAPDLLAALESVVKIADRDTEIFNKARATINKAKGIQ